MKWIATFFTLLPLLLTAQTAIQGRILDADSGEGLAFATIAFGGKGTYSNTDGYYRLESTGAGADSVRISFIGYTTFRTTVSELRASPTVRLLPAENELTQIVVRGDNEYLYALLERCRQDLLTWPTTVAKGYFQLATTLDGTPAEFMQNYYNVTSSGLGVSQLELKAGRVAVHPLEKMAYRTLGTSQSIARLALADRSDEFADHPLQLRRGALKRKYDLEEVPQFSDARTVHVRFNPGGENQQSFSGELWVDRKTAELRKLILRHPKLLKYPLNPINPSNRIGAFDVEFIYTFADRRLEHMQWRFAYEHRIFEVNQFSTVNQVAAECSVICFDPDAPFFSPRTEYSDQYGDYRKLAFFPYDTLFWENAPQVPLTERQLRQMAELGMEENRVDYGRQADSVEVDAGLTGRNMFWSPEWRFVHDKVVRKTDIKTPAFNRNRFAPAVQVFLDAFPVGDSIAFNSATFLDLYATKLAVAPSKQFNAALNIYFDLCELTRHKMLAELRAGPDDFDFVGRTYDKYRTYLEELRETFFDEVRRGKDQEHMERYNQIVVDALGINNLQVFKVYDYAWQ